VKLSNQHIAFALFGMKALCQDLECTEVRRLLQLLGNLVAADNVIGVGKGAHSPIHFSPKLLSMAFMGLKAASSDFKEVRDMLSALQPRIGRLDSQACGNCLFALQRMSSEHAECRSVLKALTQSMRANDGMGPGGRYWGKMSSSLLLRFLVACRLVFGASSLL
jgi:hypothetical protein